MKKFLLFLSLTCAAVAQVAIDWGDVDKTGSSLAHLATRSASDISSGTLPAARLPSITLNLSGTLHTSPVTFTAGVGTATLANQSANLVFAGPASGAAAAPTFRALTQADTQAATAASRNALAPRGGVAFDQTAGSRVTTTLTGQNLATDAFSVVVVETVPTANPSALEPIVIMGPDATQGSINNAFRATYSASGTVEASVVDGAGLTRATFAPSIVAGFAGKTVVWTFVRPASGELQIWLNGASVGATNSGSASPQASVTSTYLTLGLYNSTISKGGKIHSATLYNCALDSAAVQEIYELGGAVPERFKFGSQSADRVASGRGLSFGATDGAVGLSTIGTGGSGISQSSLAGGRSGTAGSFYLRLVANGVNSFFTSAELAVGAPAVGRAFRVTGWGKRASASGAMSINGVTVPATADWTYFEGLGAQGQAHTGALAGNIGITGIAGDEFHLDDVKITPVGAVVHLPLDDGIGYQLLDQSANKLHATMTTSGASHIITKTRGVVRFTTSTNGNQQILGQQALPANARVMSWTIKSSGTPTVSLGNASGGAQFASSVTLSSGLNDVTLLTRFCSTNNLWVSSNSTATIQHTVSYEVVD